MVQAKPSHHLILTPSRRYDHAHKPWVLMIYGRGRRSDTPVILHISHVTAEEADLLVAWGVKREGVTWREQQAQLRADRERARDARLQAKQNKEIARLAGLAKRREEREFERRVSAGARQIERENRAYEVVSTPSGPRARGT